MSVTVAVISLVTGIFTYLYFKTQRNFNYWKIRNVPHLKPTAFLGNYGDYILMKKTIGETAQDLCKAFPKEPYVGAYFGNKPALILQDPEYIKLITTKDFYYFNCRELIDDVYKEHAGHTLFFAFGDKWKVVRQNMTPLFSSVKMRNMFHLIEKCSHTFENMLDEEFKKSDVIDARAAMARYTMDCVIACGFGIHAKTMDGNSSENPFTIIGEKTFEISNIRGLALIMRSVWPSLFYGLGLQAFPKALSDFFYKLSVDVFKSRNYEPTKKNDFVDLLLALKKNNIISGDSLSILNKEKITLTVDDELLVAQCMVFFGAGYETSATTMGYTLYELAKNQQTQEKVLEEVDDFLRRHQNKLEYECVAELPYLLACIDETLRMYPVLNLLTREVVEDYTLPSGVRLGRGVAVHLPIYHLHHNPDFFPDPEKFQPERFLPENKQNIMPYTYMPFGEGPRICIGMRFSRMQTLSGLLTVFKKFRVELADGMPEKLELDPRSFVTASRSGIHLRLVEREGWEQRVFTR